MDARTPITLTSKVEQITPKAMPSAPSISCAAKPIAMKGSSAFQSMDQTKSNIRPLLLNAPPNHGLVQAMLCQLMR
jgi:hypothetical protein